MKGDLVAPPSEGIVKRYAKRRNASVFVERFRLPNGKPRNALLFCSTSNPVIIFPITEDRRVIAIEQFRYGANTFVKELPGGGKKPDQKNLEETVIDELLEETGYRPKKIIELGKKLWFEPATYRADYRPFLAMDCTRVKDPTPEPEEIMEPILFDIETWTQMISRGEIDDDKSIAVTWRALAHLGWRFQPPR